MVARPTPTARATPATVAEGSLSNRSTAAAFSGVSAGGLPPVRPRSRAAASPARVRSFVNAASNSATAAKMWKINRPLTVVVSMPSVRERKAIPRASKDRPGTLTPVSPGERSRVCCRASPGDDAAAAAAPHPSKKGHNLPFLESKSR